MILVSSNVDKLFVTLSLSLSLFLSLSLDKFASVRVGETLWIYILVYDFSFLYLFNYRVGKAQLYCIHSSGWFVAELCLNKLCCNYVSYSPWGPKSSEIEESISVKI